MKQHLNDTQFKALLGHVAMAVETGLELSAEFELTGASRPVLLGPDGQSLHLGAFGFTLDGSDMMYEVWMRERDRKPGEGEPDEMSDEEEQPHDV